MIRKEKAMAALMAYMLLAPLIAVYLLLFARMDFEWRIIGVVLTGAILIFLGIVNLGLLR